jgi:hypothetical protein
VPTGISTSYGGGTSIVISADGTATVTFETQYYLSVSTTSGGTVTGNEEGPWYDSGASVTLTAVPNPGPPGVGYYFVSWNGSGAAAQVGSTPVITVVMTSPVTEWAQFLLKPTSAPRTFILTVTETGLPTGDQWNATVGAIGNTTTNTTMQISGLNGTYMLSAPIVSGGPGVRYNASNGTGAITVFEANASVTVTFSTEYLLTVQAAGNGTATPLGGQWVKAGTSVPLTASTVNTSWMFEAWKGTTTSNASTLSVTVNGPTTEVAQFVPVPPKSTSVNVLEGAPIAIALLIVLLVVGIVVAFLMTRRRGGSTATAEPAVAPQRDGMTEETAEPSEAETPAEDSAVEAEP